MSDKHAQRKQLEHNIEMLRLDIIALGAQGVYVEDYLLDLEMLKAKLLNKINGR